MRGRRGATLVEVVISILLVAMMTGPIMSTVLSASMAQKRSEHRVAAAAAARGLSERLKAFVTADRSLANGPGVGRDGWSLPGDGTEAYALAPGTHRLDAGVWAPGLKDCGGSISYSVAVRDTPSGPEPDVRMNVSWEDR